MKLPVLLLVAGALGFSHSSSRAETLLECDFTKFNSAEMTVETAPRKSEEPVVLKLMGEAAAVVPEGETNAPGAIPALARGWVECGGSPEAPGGLASSAGYSKIAGVANGFGSGTIVAVFQPFFSGPLLENGPRGRAVFFATNYGGTAEEAIQFGILEKRLILAFGIGSAASRGQRAATAQPDWSPDQWYFLAASWQPQAKPTIYWRQLGTSEGTFVEGTEALADCKGPVKKMVRIGNGGSMDANLPGNSSMKGKMSYFLWANSYAGSLADYNALYKLVTGLE